MRALKSSLKVPATLPENAYCFTKDRGFQRDPLAVIQFRFSGLPALGDR